MRDIFGPDTRITRDERNIAQKLVKGREVIYPIFDDDNLISICSGNPISGDKSDLGVEFFSMFKKDLIIPFDFTRIPRQDFMVPTSNKKIIGEYKAEYRKFIARPDFFYVGFDNEKAHLFPIDLKSSNSKNIHQTSMMNSAMLYSHSDYMQHIVNYLKENFNSKVILENGFFLFDDEYRVSNKESLEGYINNFLPKSIKQRGKNVNLGIEALDGNPKLVFDTEDLFKTNMDYQVSQISESNMIAYFSFIKGRFSNTTIYPSAVSSINGFNGGRKPIFRLNYNPETRIKTFNPEIGFIEDDIERIYEMTPEEIINYHFSSLPSKIELDSTGKMLDTLKMELEAKKRNKSFRIQKKLEEEFELGSNESMKSYESSIVKLDKKIINLENKIEKVSKDFFLKREEVYLQNIPKKGSLELSDFYIQIKNALIGSMSKELEEQKMKTLAWRKKDINLNKFLSKFHLNINLNSDLELSSNSYLPLPMELYMQLKSKEIMKINLFNSYNVK